MMKMAKNYSFEELCTMFALGDGANAELAVKIFKKVLIFYFQHCVNIPNVLDGAGQVRQGEVDRLLDTAFTQTQTFYRALVQDFEDPAGRGRDGVVLLIDATYIDTTNSLDLEHQKYTFYCPRSGHTVKLITMKNCTGKFVSVFPLCSSQSPSSGDAYLTATYARLSDHLRTILRGNNIYFVILITDAGFVMESPRAPRAVQNVPSLTRICDECSCVLLHTSNTNSTYHLVRNAAGGIVKSAPRDPSLRTLSQNTVAFTRIFRKVDEMSHGGVKQQMKILNAKKLPNSYLQSFTTADLRRYGLGCQFENVSKLSFIAVAAMSLFNQYHPGFKLLFIGDQTEQLFNANQYMERLWKENSLIYSELWPVNLTGRDNQWRQITVGELWTPGGKILSSTIFHHFTM